MTRLRVAALQLAVTALLAVTAVTAVTGLAGCARWQAAQLYGSGTEALDRGDVALAIHDLERAAALAPQASEVQNHLGLAYGAAGRHEESLAAFERAVDLDCDNAAARENLTAARRHPGGAMP